MSDFKNIQGDRIEDNSIPLLALSQEVQDTISKAASGGGFRVVATSAERDAIAGAATLNADGISIGERKLGMRVYVAQEERTYELRVAGYFGLDTASKIYALGLNTNWAMVVTQLTEMKYDELRELCSKYELVPGNRYLLTDFQTVHVISETIAVCENGATVSEDYTTYVQRDPFNNGAEPLILTAASASAFHTQVISTIHPTDIIHYDFSMQDSRLPSVVIPGRITFRLDTTHNLSTHYDFRGVRNRRWRFIPPTNFETGVIVQSSDGRAVLNFPTRGVGFTEFTFKVEKREQAGYIALADDIENSPSFTWTGNPPYGFEEDNFYTLRCVYSPDGTQTQYVVSDIQPDIFLELGYYSISNYRDMSYCDVDINDYMDLPTFCIDPKVDDGSFVAQKYHENVHIGMYTYGSYPKEAEPNNAVLMVDANGYGADNVYIGKDSTMLMLVGNTYFTTFTAGAYVVYDFRGGLNNCVFGDYAYNIYNYASAYAVVVPTDSGRLFFHGPISQLRAQHYISDLIVYPNTQVQQLSFYGVSSQVSIYNSVYTVHFRGEANSVQFCLNVSNLSFTEQVNNATFFHRVNNSTFNARLDNAAFVSEISGTRIDAPITTTVLPSLWQTRIVSALNMTHPVSGNYENVVFYEQQDGTSLTHISLDGQLRRILSYGSFLTPDIALITDDANWNDANNGEYTGPALSTSYPAEHVVYASAATKGVRYVTDGLNGVNRYYSF